MFVLPLYSKPIVISLFFFLPQEILEKFTARQLRLAFLTQLWNSKVDFSESLMTGEVRNLEVTLNVSKHFFLVDIHPSEVIAEFLYERESPRQSSKRGGNVI